MPRSGRIHDRAILDALEALDPEPFSGIVWRVTRKGREPIRGAAANGRWSTTGEFEVLYTSLERERALAEIGFRLSQEPVWPSRIEHELHSVRVEAERLIRFADLPSLEPFAIDAARYRSFEYTATQSLAAAVHFLEFDGLIVPNARFECLNLVLFTERSPKLTLVETQPVDWEGWRRRRIRR